MTFDQWTEEISKNVSLGGNEKSRTHVTVYDDLSGDAEEETSKSDGEKDSFNAPVPPPHSLLKKPLDQIPLRK